MELPPLHDDRWDHLVQAVLDDERPGNVLVRHDDGRRDEAVHRVIEVPSGRRSSASS